MFPLQTTVRVFRITIILASWEDINRPYVSRLGSGTDADVMFCPLFFGAGCGVCKRMQPIFQQAATETKGKYVSVFEKINFACTRLVHRCIALTASDSPVSSVCRWDGMWCVSSKSWDGLALALGAGAVHQSGGWAEGKICPRWPAAKLFNAISQHIPRHASGAGQDNNPNGL